MAIDLESQEALVNEVATAEAAADNAALFQIERPHMSMHDSIFVMLTPEGNPSIFRSDTRYHESILTVNGKKPLVDAHSYDRDARTRTFELRVPLTDDENGEAILINRNMLAWKGAVLQELTVSNPTSRRQRVTIEFDSRAPLLDTFEIRGAGAQEYWGIHLMPETTRDSVRFVYVGSDKSVSTDRFRQITHLRFGPEPDQLTPSLARYELTLPAGAEQKIFMEAHCLEIAPGRRAKPIPPVPPERMYVRVGERLARATQSFKRMHDAITTNNEDYNQVMGHALADQSMLSMQTPNGPVPVAGLPWFARLFGRDSLIASRFNMWRDPSMAKAVLLEHAANQAKETNIDIAAEPGKIIHERCLGEMARTGQVVYRRYYGSGDAPPLYVVTLGEYADRTLDLATVRECMPAAELALNWMMVNADHRGDGLLRFKRKHERDLAMQGWQDSGNSNFHADGEIMKGTIALVEVQALFVEALQHGEKLAKMVAAAEELEGNRSEAKRLRQLADTYGQRATHVRQAIEDRFWDDQLGTYGVALDDDKLGRIRKSNAGWVLASGIASPERAERVAKLLMGETMFSGWGVRTADTREKLYGDEVYHNGCVWGMDNAHVMRGMRQYEFLGDAARIQQVSFETALHFGFHTPELFSGAPRRGVEAPKVYPNACPIHIFGASGQVGMVPSMLGMKFAPRADGRGGTVIFERPYIPAFMNGEITLRDLPIGEGRVDVRLRGERDDVELKVLSSRRGATARLVTATL